MPRKCVMKPYRVSYYFPRTAENGKARLYSRPVTALDVAGAKAEVERIFKGCDVVIVNAYRFYYPLKAKRATYIRVPQVSSPTSSYPATLVTLMDSPCTFGMPEVSRFEGPIENRLPGPCKWHPNAVVLKDGRCTALETIGIFPTSEISYREFLSSGPPSLRRPSNLWHGSCDPCVSQQVKDTVYGDCEAEKAENRRLADKAIDKILDPEPTPALEPKPFQLRTWHIALPVLIFFAIVYAVQHWPR